MDMDTGKLHRSFGDYARRYTVQAKGLIGTQREVYVCGTVVSTRISRSGNLWINLDKQFPNQIFSVYIPKDDLINFSYDVEKELLYKQVCIKGRVENLNKVPTMKIRKEN